MRATAAVPFTTHRIIAAEGRLEDLVDVLADQTELADYPHATDVTQQVLVYESTVAGLDGDELVSLEGEIARALRTGPGIVVFRRAFGAPVVDRATAAFVAMIAAQRKSGTAGGDHFAKPGANDRVWNALEKLAVEAPDVFVDYYANDVVALAARSWLGPAYQITSQVNVVNPGGAAQTVHRDYHLGFQSDERCGQFPPHVHDPRLRRRARLPAARWRDDAQRLAEQLLVGHFVAVGRGHDTAYWTDFLRALQKVDPDMPVNIEHEDQELDPLEGLRFAAQTLIDAEQAI